MEFFIFFSQSVRTVWEMFSVPFFLKCQPVFVFVLFSSFGFLCCLYILFLKFCIGYSCEVYVKDSVADLLDLLRITIGGSLDELESESFSVSSGVIKLRTSISKDLFLTLARLRRLTSSLASSEGFTLTVT